MSINVTNAQIEEFSAIVKKIYQARGFHLRDTVRTRMNVLGSTIRFTLQGEGIAQQKASQDDVIPMNIEYSNVEAAMGNWHASEFTDIFDQREINFDEKTELAGAIAMAIGRRSDQIVIDSADTAILPPQNIIPVAASNFTYAKVRAINAVMNANGVGRGDRVIVLTAAGESSLLDEDKLTSSDFVRQMVIDRGGLDGQKLFNFTFKVIPDMPNVGGLPKVGTVATCFAYEKQAIGMGVGMDFSTEINYIPLKTSWLTTGKFKAGATAIDTKGIVSIAIDEAL